MNHNTDASSFNPELLNEAMWGSEGRVVVYWLEDQRFDPWTTAASLSKWADTGPRTALCVNRRVVTNQQIQFMITGLSWSTEDGNKVKFCSPFHRSHVYVPSKGMQLYIITFGGPLTPPHSSQPVKTGVKLECLLHLPVSPLCPWFVCSGYEGVCNSFYCMLYIHNLRTGKRSQTLLPLCTVGGNAPSSTRLWCATLLTSATLYSSNTLELLNLIERKSH